MRTTTTSLLTVGVIILTYLFTRLLRVGRRPKGYPPGPPTIPILGNIHQMPTRDAHKQFQAWAREYGPIYSLILGTRVMIVLSSATVAKDLLDKRSAIYSDRQDMYIGMKLCSDNLRMLMMRYDSTWRMIRKICHGLLNISTAKSYVPYQMLENKQMLHEMLVQPDRFLEHIRRYANSLTTSMLYGWRAPSYEDKDVQQLFSGFEKFSVINQTGAAALLDAFPILRWLPDWVVTMQRQAKELHNAEKPLYMKHWLNCKESVKNGTAKPCFCVNLARLQESEGFSDDLACYTAGSLLEAGSDTTSSTLFAFVQAMVLFPEVQKRAQDEIDRVVGPDRLPIIEDEPNLQYVRGCVKESLRWMPTAILGFPHAVMVDDSYMGYHIPAGAGVLCNVYTIHHDPDRYPNPRIFDPSRFKDDFQSAANAASNPDASKRDHFTFGAGRRICQGMHVAERSLFLGISRLLWGFNFEPAKDAQGDPVYPDPEKLTQGFVCMPEPFQANIKPRDKHRANMIEREWNVAQAEL